MEREQNVEEQLSAIYKNKFLNFSGKVETIRRNKDLLQILKDIFIFDIFEFFSSLMSILIDLSLSLLNTIEKSNMPRYFHHMRCYSKIYHFPQELFEHTNKMLEILNTHKTLLLTSIEIQLNLLFDIAKHHPEIYYDVNYLVTNYKKIYLIDKKLQNIYQLKTNLYKNLTKFPDYFVKEFNSAAICLNVKLRIYQMYSKNTSLIDILNEVMSNDYQVLHEMMEFRDIIYIKYQDLLDNILTVTYTMENNFKDGVDDFNVLKIQEFLNSVKEDIRLFVKELLRNEIYSMFYIDILNHEIFYEVIDIMINIFNRVEYLRKFKIIKDYFLKIPHSSKYFIRA